MNLSVKVEQSEIQIFYKNNLEKQCINVAYLKDSCTSQQFDAQQIHLYSRQYYNMAHPVKHAIATKYKLLNLL